MTGSLNCETTPTSTDAGELTLRIVGSEHDGRVIRIQSPKCTIGSSRGSTLRLRAPGVHDVHCLIMRGPGGLVARNWSRDTRLNGRQFEDAYLTPGDRLTVGPVQLEILPTGTPEGDLSPASSASRDDQVRLQRLERLAREEAQQRVELARQCAQHEQFVAQLQAKLSEAESLIEQLRQESAATPTGETPATIDPAALAEFETLKHQAEALTEQFEVARKSFASEREGWQNERSQLQFSVMEVERRVDILTATLTQAREDARKERDAWEAERAALHADLEKLRHLQHQHLEIEKTSGEAKVAVMHWREQYEDQVRLLADRDRQLAELVSQGAATSDEEYLKLRAELEADARELDAETERFFAAETAFQAERAAWQLECEQLAEAQNARRLELETQLATLNAEREQLESLRNENAGQSPPLEQEQARLAAWQQELDERAHAIAHEQDQLAAERNLLAEYRAEMEERAAAIEGRQAQQDELAAQLSTQRDALAKERQELEQQRAELEQQSFLPTPVDPHAEAAIESQRAELASWQETLQRREQSLTQQQEHLSLDRVALREEREQFAAERAAWTPPPPEAPDYSPGLAAIESQRAELASWQAALSEREQSLTQEQEHLAQDRDGLHHEREQLVAERAAWSPPQVEVPATPDHSLDLAAIDSQRAELTAWQEDLAAREQAISEQEERLTAEREALLAQQASQVVAGPGTSALDEIHEELTAARDELAREREDLARERAWLEEQRSAWEQSQAESTTSTTIEEPEPQNLESASDVIARLSASGLWKDDTEEPIAEEPTTPEPAWKSLVAEEPKPVAPVVHHDDDDSIESYMQRLLMRVSGDSEGHRAPKPAPANAQVEPQVEVDNSLPITDLSEHHQPFDFKTFVPRSTAPELAKNLAAMRELANSTARSAIDVSGKSQRRRKAHAKYVLALLATATTVGSYWFSSQYSSRLALVGALASLVAALVWGTQATLMWRAILQDEKAEAAGEATEACDLASQSETRV